MDRHRVIDVRGPKAGSGYLLSDTLVLTAAHILFPAPERAARHRGPGDSSPTGQQILDQAEVRLPGGARGFKARLLWSRYGSSDRGPDFALLKIDDSDWVPLDPTPIRWGRLEGDAEVRVHAFGFPDVSPGTELSPVVGTVHTTSGWQSNRPELSLDGGEPIRESPGKSWWAGLSGGPVFEASGGVTSDILLGVVVTDPPEFGSRRLRIVPASVLLDDAAAMAIVTEHSGEIRVVRCPATGGAPPGSAEPRPIRVFVDATPDAAEYPADATFLRAALDGASQAGAVVVDGTTLAGSERLNEVRRCDVYASAVGFRYGPVQSEGGGLSAVDLAYTEARAASRVCRIFLLDDDAPVPRRLIDPDARAIDGFRRRLRNDPGVRHFTFSTAAQLTGMLLRELAQVSAPSSALPVPPAPGGQEFAVMRARYLARLRETYRRLDLDALTPSEQEDNAPVLLQQVFMPQQVRPGPPPLELPKELQRKLTEVGDLPEEPSGHVEPERWLRSLAQFREQVPRQVLAVLADPVERLVVLLGDPGAGKSTLARHLALSLAAEPGATPAVGRLSSETRPVDWLGRYATWLPVMIELRIYAEQQSQSETFLQFLAHRYRTDGLGLPATELDRFLRDDGRAWVMFDGLDELFDLQERENAARQIAGFAARYPKTRILVTSRSTGYQRKILDDGGFTTFTLQDLDSTQIESFVANWYQVAYAGQEADAKLRSELLLTSIEASASIRELAGNPLLLTILTIIGRMRELPRERHAMYAHAASVLVEHWDVRRYLKDRDIEAEPIDSEDKKELLRRIARVVQSTRQTREGNFIDRERLLTEFESYLIDRYQYHPARAKKIAHTMLRQFRERNFILSMLGPGIYGFVHRAFLEYFCADDLRRRFETTQEISIDKLSSDYFCAHWAEDTWHEVLLLTADMLDEQFTARLLADVLAEHDPSLMLADGQPPHNLALAARAITDARYPARLTNLGRAVLEATARLLEAAACEQSSFAQAAVDFVETQVLPPLQAAGIGWPSRDTYLAWFAAHSTGLGPPVISEPTILSTIRAEDVAARIAAALGHGDAELLQLLRDQAQSAFLPSMRQAAVRAIAVGWHDEPDMLQWLVDHTMTDGDVVRSTVVEAIATGWHDDPGTLPWLRDRAVADASEAVRSTAVEAIAAGWHDSPEILAWLRARASADVSDEVRSTAAEAISAGQATGEIRIGLWGAPASGKTSYLAALYVAATSADDRSGRWSTYPVDDSSSRRIQKLTSELLSGRFPAATSLDSATPLSSLFVGDLTDSIYRSRLIPWRRRLKAGRFLLEMIDFPGEAFGGHERSTGGRVIEHLAESQGLIYLFDPIAETTERSSATSFGSVMSQLSARIYGEESQVGRYLPHYVSVCVTKFDNPRIFHQARKMDLVKTDENGQYRVPDEDAERFFDMLCTGRFWPQEETMQAAQGAQFIRDSLRAHFAPDRIRYFVTSSIGLRRSADFRVNPGDFSDSKMSGQSNAEIDGPIDPINVIEPVVSLAQRIAEGRDDRIR